MADGRAARLAEGLSEARRRLGLDPGEPARTWEVARRGGEGPGFVLVVFGPGGAASGVASVDPASGEVLAHGRLPGRVPHTPMSAEDARRAAGVGAAAEARLVWDPTSASRSPFYPLWELRDGERTVWVDAVRGDVWSDLFPAGRPPRGGGGR